MDALSFGLAVIVLSVALGIVLILVSFAVNVFFNYLQGRSGN